MIVDIQGLSHRYRREAGEVAVLDGVELQVDRGDFIAVMGTSGSGKSTLLHILGCLLRPTGGSYLLNDEQMITADEKRLSRIRSRTIGQVFQMFHLFPEMDVVQNVSLPFLYSGVRRGEAGKRVNDAIEKVGLSARRRHKPSELSGGEMQRTAIARALVQKPDLILADEPTGNLDTENSNDILELFLKMNRDGHTIVMVTHDAGVASCANKTLCLRDGRLHHS